MKKSICALFSIVSLLGLASCGNEAEKGEQGIPGLNGSNGLNGSDGIDGSNGLSAYEIYCKYHPQYKGTEKDWINALANGDLAKSYNTSYNIIYTLATIPPVLSALESIGNGNETYAMIERGKTYSGIDMIDSFHNIGFNKGSNSSAGFTQDLFDKVVKTVEELNVYGNEKFNIFVQDGTALEGLAIAANSKLNLDQYHIIMCEDGTGAYQALKNTLVNGKNVSSSVDEVYNAYCDNVKAVENDIKTICTRSNNNVDDKIFDYNIGKAFSLAAYENFTYWLQDEQQVEDILVNVASTDNTKTKLLSSFGFAEEEVEYKLNLKFKGINECVNNFTPKQKEDYLTLMYGQYYEDTYNALTRKSLTDGTKVPDKKLVFIGSRIKASPDLITAVGVGLATSKDDVPNSYQELNSKYKNSLMFSNEADYMVFIDALNNSKSYLTEPSNKQKNAIRVSAFNYYLNYIFTLKYTYSLYGKDYDIIMKGHPSEVLGSYENWTNHYEAEGYKFDKLINDACLSFHTKDSIGKYIGMVPYGTAAENLAYLGADISIGGLNSSTYTGYDTSVDVLFVLEVTNDDITKNTNLNSRYEVGNLTYTKNNETKVTKYDNTGNILKSLAYIYSTNNEEELSNQYNSNYDEWLRKSFDLTDATGYDINDQGILVTIK